MCAKEFEEIDSSVPREEMVQRASMDAATFDALIGMLSEGGRRNRQYASAVVLEIAQTQPEILVPVVDQMVDALDRPEAQTRWQMLNALVYMVPFDLAACQQALDAAVASLYDEESDFVRLASLRFLCAVGAEGKELSSKVWPFLDEAIQCYHGDVEFSDMLNALIAFSKGNIAPEVKKALAERMAFDAENARGALKRRAEQIVENCKA